MSEEELEQARMSLGWEWSAEVGAEREAMLRLAIPEIDRLRALVKAAECPNEDQCPWCRTYTQPGFADPHEPDCPAFWPDGRVR